MKSSSNFQIPASLLFCATSAPLAPPTQRSLFELAPDSECSELLSTASQLASFAPEILVSIEGDLDTYALEKKRKRWEHQRWIEEQTGALIELPPADMGKLQLEQGRPRMHPLAVLSFLFLRGWLGGGKDARLEVMLRESVSLHIFLRNLDQPFPGASTIEENLNALSIETREIVLKAELALAFEEKLEDFESLRIDSTHCASASAYPTDSGTLTKLLCRMSSRMQKVERIALRACDQIQGTQLGEWSEEMRQLNYRICTLTSSSAIEAEKAERSESAEQAGKETGTNEQKPKNQGIGRQKESAKTKLRRELYCELYTKAQGALEVLAPMVETLREQIEESESSPQMQAKRELWIAVMEEDLQAAAKVIEQSRRRVCEGKKPSASAKMPLSVSDLSASFIEKGSWERVFGYRPQLAFSGKGLVSALLVPEGNASDQSQLSLVVEEAIANTGIIPRVVTVDDGYTGEGELLKVQAAGVEVVSFSGARGRALLGEEKWNDERYAQARRDRNGAESGVSVLKAKVRFGQLSRTGIEAVRAEQMEKVLSANALKIVALRRRKYKEEQRASWSSDLPGKREKEAA